MTSTNLHKTVNSSTGKGLSFRSKVELQERTQNTISRAFRTDRPILVNAPPGSGKTYGTFEVAANLEEPIMYLTERRDLYNQAQKLADDNGLTPKVLPSPHRECPTF